MKCPQQAGDLGTGIWSGRDGADDADAVQPGLPDQAQVLLVDASDGENWNLDGSRNRRHPERADDGLFGLDGSSESRTGAEIVSALGDGLAGFGKGLDGGPDDHSGRRDGAGGGDPQVLLPEVDPPGTYGHGDVEVIVDHQQRPRRGTGRLKSRREFEEPPPVEGLVAELDQLDPCPKPVPEKGLQPRRIVIGSDGIEARRTQDQAIIGGHIHDRILTLQLHINLLDLAIVALAGAALWDGARRGFVPYASELVALGAGLGVAFTFFSPVGSTLSRIPGVPAGLTTFGAFLALLLVSHALVLALAQAAAGMLSIKLRPHLPQPARGAAGSLPALGLAAMVLAVVLSALVVLPEASASDLVFGSALGRPVAAGTSFLQPPLRQLLGQARPQVGNILQGSLPVDPGSNAFYKLHFPNNLHLVVDPRAESTMLAQMNSVRRQAGLSALTLLPQLQSVARQHSRDMYVRDYFSHRTPNGLSPYDRLTAAGVSYVTAGENIAFAPNEAQAWSLLIQSPDHRANILDPDFLCAGVGVIKGAGRYEEMFTQEFTDC